MGVLTLAREVAEVHHLLERLRRLGALVAHVVEHAEEILRIGDRRPKPVLLSQPLVFERGLSHPHEIARLPVHVGQPGEKQGAVSRARRVVLDRCVE